MNYDYIPGGGDLRARHSGVVFIEDHVLHIRTGEITWNL
jgi:hypothetical protein